MQLMLVGNQPFNLKIEFTTFVFQDASMCRSNSLLSLMMSEKMEQEITPDKVALPSSLETTVGRIKIDNKLLYSFHG